MGCDIHTYVEVLVTPKKWDTASQTDVDLTPRWKMVKEKIFDYDYFRPEDPIDPFSRYGNRPYDSHPYHGRNYELFSVLADVRNEGPYTNVFMPSMRMEMRNRVAPIALPRGVPEDASKSWVKRVEKWGEDMHSQSWFTLTELQAAAEGGASEQQILNRGYVDANEFRLLLAAGTKPTVWAGWSSNGISRKAWDEMGLGAQSSFKGSVAAEWPDVIDCSSFVEKTIPQLAKLAPYKADGPTWTWDDRRAGKPDLRVRDTDKVRMVFGFDN